MTEFDGGAAFPLQDWDPNIKSPRYHRGMSLRDYFANAAMQAWISAQPTIAGERLNAGKEHAKVICEACYVWADEMLKAREIERESD